jgi:hypothetical protein
MARAGSARQVDQSRAQMEELIAMKAFMNRTFVLEAE